jgi:acyl carrier protein
MTTLQTIQRMMVDQFELKIETLTPDAQLESLGLDSLSIIEFMFNIEDEFHIKLPDQRVEIKTIQDISSIVERLISEKKTTPE